MADFPVRFLNRSPLNNFPIRSLTLHAPEMGRTDIGAGPSRPHPAESHPGTRAVRKTNPDAFDMTRLPDPSKRPRHRRGAPGLLAALLVLCLPATADEPDADLTFADRSIEELLAMTVTSVAGVERSLSQTPAALSAISRDDIHRAGHLSLPEAMRMVPGVYVARTDSNTWSIGTRGFNGGFGNKQLVLIDGRVTYDLLFSGTFWDVQDVMLEDLERVEVVRGPGATLWGANAVNGVINITTRSARDTQGVSVSGGGGTHERLFSQLRYGSRLGERAWFRVWGKHFERAAFDDLDGTAGHDAWRMTRGGFRIDGETERGVTVTVQGDAYSGDINEFGAGFPDAGWARGHNVLTRLGRGDNADDGWWLQAWFDHTSRRTSGGFEVDRDTWDLDLRRYVSFDRHATIWGVGLRYTSDQTRPSDALQIGRLLYDPEARSARTVTAFFQDTITLRPDKAYLMVGSKFGHNAFSGFEVQPSARVWWLPDERSMLWAAVSRPVRTPSRTDEDLAVSIPGLLTFTGNPDVDAERLVALEAGYRRRLSDDLSLDFAAFHQDYRDLLATVGPLTALSFDNSGAATTTGFELAGLWQPGDRWHLRGSYSLLSVDQSGSPVDTPDGSAPRHMVKLHANAHLTERLHVNGALYWIDEVPLTAMPAYTRLDLGLNWRLPGGLALRLSAQNVLDEGVAESPGDANAEVPRAFYLELSYRH